jgi:hypothetical protein
MTAPAGSAAYNPNTWKLGYQTRQFGQGQDPLPASVTANVPNPNIPSVCASLATPPTHMAASAALALPAAPATAWPSSPIVPNQ